MYVCTRKHDACISPRASSNPDGRLMDARESREDFCESLFRARAKLSPNLHLDDDGGGCCCGDKRPPAVSITPIFAPTIRARRFRSFGLFLSTKEFQAYIVHEENTDWVVALALGLALSARGDKKQQGLRHQRT